MSISSKIFRAFTSFLLIFALAVLAFADTVRLKDGSIIKGRIVNFGGGKFTVAIGDGARKREMTFAASEVESINFDSPPISKESINQNASYEEPTSETIKQLPAKIIVGGTNTPPVVTVHPRSSGETMKPIEWQIKVRADSTANGWTNSGWVVKKGQRIRIVGDGTVSLGKGKNSTPSGISSLDDPQKLLKNVPTGALVAVIGDDNNDFIYVGSEREFTATRDGALFLGINEGYLEDNSGAFDVKVEIIPDSAK